MCDCKRVRLQIACRSEGAHVRLETACVSEWFLHIAIPFTRSCASVYDCPCTLRLHSCVPVQACTIVLVAEADEGKEDDEGKEKQAEACLPLRARTRV